MKRPGPLLTLLAGLLLGLLTLALDATAGTRSASSSYQERPPAPTPTSSTASRAPAPSPSPSKITDASYAGRTDDDSSSVAVSVRDGRATATVRGAKVDGGWIVLADGRQAGLADREGTPSSAPRIAPETGAVTVDGQPLTANPVLP
ncbi:hypothetical protein [Streptomyces sp. NPDC001833]|uniref:hypothetical protein n=1 Tax=Streptomyces sp. NPDC001833 TaxID=3154658 RepID=UPI00332491B0